MSLLIKGETIMTKMRVNTLKKFMLAVSLCLLPHGARAAVNLEVQDIAPAYSRYYYDNAALKLSLWTDSGTSLWSSLSVNISGTLMPSSDMSSISIYKDDGDGEFSTSSDTYVTGYPVNGPSVTLTMGAPETTA